MCQALSGEHEQAPRYIVLSIQSTVVCRGVREHSKRKSGIREHAYNSMHVDV